MNNARSLYWTTSRLVVAVLNCALIAGATTMLLADNPPPVDTQTLGETIKQLIRQLGDVEYAQREKAQAELEQLGLIAFDALRDAADNDDIEIALRAQYVLRTMQIRWVRETDPREVRELLRDYDEKPVEDRQALMSQLDTIPGERGSPALCRIARFDPSGVASKRAALLVIQQPRLGATPVEVDVATVIPNEIGFSERPAADWLRLYAQSLQDPDATLDQWSQVIREEQQMFADRPDRTAEDIVLGLLRWQVDLLTKAGRTEQALAVMRETIDGLDGNVDDLLDAVDWLIEREAWSVVQETAEKYPQAVAESVRFTHRLAEAALRQGDVEEAKRLAGQALQINPADQDEHNLAAIALTERGHFDWAEREYRQVIQQGPLGAFQDLRARLLLSEMLHDLEREEDAADALQAAADLIERDASVADRLREAGRDANGLVARMYYFKAEQARREGNSELQVELLSKAIEREPEDADVLIAMYRLPNADEAWRRDTLQRIRQATDEFRRKIRMIEQIVAEATIARIRADAIHALATANNQLAWLVSNTTGNYQEALRCSHRSLELRPNSAGFFDTLGRCYFAVGDLDNAIRYQRLAVELEPHTHQIRRQLKLFEEAKHGSSGDGAASDESDAT